MSCPHLPRAQRNNELVSPLVIVRTCEHIMVYGQSHWALLMFCLGPAQARERAGGGRIRPSSHWLDREKINKVLLPVSDTGRGLERMKGKCLV